VVVVLTELDFKTPPLLRPPSARDRKPLPKRITNKQREQAVELYKTGLSLNAVGRELGIARQAVRKAVVDVGVSLRPRYDL
jgi:transposase-like protein